MTRYTPYTCPKKWLPPREAALPEQGEIIHDALPFSVVRFYTDAAVAKLADIVRKDDRLNVRTAAQVWIDILTVGKDNELQRRLIVHMLNPEPPTGTDIWVVVRNAAKGGFAT